MKEDLLEGCGEKCTERWGVASLGCSLQACPYPNGLENCLLTIGQPIQSTHPKRQFSRWVEWAQGGAQSSAAPPDWWEFGHQAPPVEARPAPIMGLWWSCRGFTRGRWVGPDQCWWAWTPLVHSTALSVSTYYAREEMAGAIHIMWWISCWAEELSLSLMDSGNATRFPELIWLPSGAAGLEVDCVGTKAAKADRDNRPLFSDPELAGGQAASLVG